MKKIAAAWFQTFFGKNLEFRVKLFHVLAITGVIICVIMTGVSLAGEMYISAGFNFGAGLVSLFLLLYSAWKQRYRFCYITTLVVIFFLLFPSLFFYGGGYHGGMPFFFVFAVVFTVYMLDGWGMVAVTAVELIFYALLCIIAYRHPQMVVPFASEWDVVVDVIIGLVTVSISLGVTMFVQIRMYQRQQKDLEQAQKEAESASRAKSVFLANMSHEIRTPIHMILGMNEIIHRESRSRQVRDYSEKIDETSKMLLSLVDSILDVSKIESGKMELIPAPYESANLVQTLALIGRTYCSKKKLEFECRIADDLPPMLLGDLAHIRQIAANFLSNAAKYTQTGRIILTVSQEPGPEESQILLCISVQDTGIGIRKEAIPTLFEAFTRADLAAHRDISGTGLGLAIVRELTELMNGTIHVDSEPGSGSTFSVRLPQTVLQDSRKAEQETPVTFRAPRARLLVVDDNEGNRALMRELLVPTGMEMDSAASGRDCLRMVQENTYDVILMDYMMPEMDGLETVRCLRQLPGFTTPVIALTADATAGTEQKLLAGGFSAYLTKPIPWSSLRETLLQYLPPKLVTLVAEQSPEAEDRMELQELQEKLKPFGISADQAMQYFRNNLEEYGMVAQLFLRHDTREQNKVAAFFQQEDWTGMRFPIHALKGKARNLGLTPLAEVCAYVETLCVSGQSEEIKSLRSYLFYLWRRGSEGLELLTQELSPTQEPRTTAQPDSADPQMLKELLQKYRRKPAQECLQQLMDRETQEPGRRMLREVRDRVDAFAFDQAAQAYQSYLEWKKEEQDEASGTYSGR